MAEQHLIRIDQTGAVLTITSACPGDRAVFGVNELVTDAHFAPPSCQGFRARVLSIWGRGGPRTTTQRVQRDFDDGRPSIMVPEDRYDPAAEVDGSIRLGRRPHAAWPPRE